MVLPGPSVLFLLIRRGASVLSLDYEVCVFSRMSVLHVPLPCRTRVSSPPFRVHYIPCVRSLKGNLKRKQIPSRSVTRPPETAEALHTLKDSDRGAEVGACVHPGEGGRAPPLRGGGGGGGTARPGRLRRAGAAFPALRPHSSRYGLIHRVTASSIALRPHSPRGGRVLRPHRAGPPDWRALGPGSDGGAGARPLAEPRRLSSHGPPLGAPKQTGGRGGACGRRTARRGRIFARGSRGLGGGGRTCASALGRVGSRGMEPR